MSGSSQETALEQVLAAAAGGYRSGEGIFHCGVQIDDSFPRDGREAPMILRVMALGFAGLAVAGAATVAAGAGVAMLACAAKRRAEARTAWPADEAGETPPTTAES
jgi:hypothetical protein